MLEALLIFGTPREAEPVDGDLVARFVTLELRRHELYQAGKIGTANKIFSKFYRTCAREIRALPDQGLSILRHLIEHAHPEVRLTAAFLLLRLDEPRAVEVLEEIAGRRIWPTSTNAKVTLEEWHNGNLKVEVEWFMRD